MNRILSDESCTVCGDQLMILTEAKQPDAPGWMAFDGDAVICDDCGFQAQVSADGETGAYITWDDCTPHNLMAAYKYERRIQHENN